MFTPYDGAAGMLLQMNRKFTVGKLKSRLTYISIRDEDTRQTWECLLNIWFKAHLGGWGGYNYRIGNVKFKPISIYLLAEKNWASFPFFLWTLLKKFCLKWVTIGEERSTISANWNVHHLLKTSSNKPNKDLLIIKSNIYVIFSSLYVIYNFLCCVKQSMFCFWRQWCTFKLTVITDEQMNKVFFITS